MKEIMVSRLTLPELIVFFLLSACNTRSGKPIEDVKPPSIHGIDYLLSFNSVKGDYQSMMKVFYIMDSSTTMFVSGGDETDRYLYSLEAGRHDIHEIIGALNAMPGINGIKFVALDRPHNEKILNAARQFLYDFGLDTKSIPDAEMRTYFTSLFSGENKYVLHSFTAPGSNGVSPAIISLQADLIREVAMQDNSRDVTRIDSVTTNGNVTVEHVTIISEREAPDPPDAPVKKK